MAEYIVTDTELTETADAIRGKTGDSAGIEWKSGSGFADAIGTISVGSTGDWVRPADWPNLDLIDMADFEGVYFSYDNRENDGYYFAGFYVETYSGDYTVERGSLTNGVFTVIDTHAVSSGTDFAEYIGTAWGDFVIYRVTASNRIKKIAMRINHPDGGIGSETPANQHCVERYGRLPNLTEFVHSSYTRTWGCSFTEHDKIYDLTSLTTLSNMYARSNGLHLLELPGFSFTDELSRQNFADTFLRTGLIDVDLRALGFSGGTGTQGSVTPLAAKRIILPHGFAVTFDWYPPTSTLEYLDMRNCTMTMFPRLNNAFKLKYLNMDGVDVSTINNIYLNYLYSLTDFYPPTGIHTTLNLAASPLSRESLLRVLDALATVDSTVTLYLRGGNLRKLTEEEIAIATEKGWTVL